jgi:hypothetical protein
MTRDGEGAPSRTWATEIQGDVTATTGDSSGDGGSEGNRDELLLRPLRDRAAVEEDDTVPRLNVRRPSGV